MNNQQLITNLINELETCSIAPIQNKKMLAEYLCQNKVTFYAWECMPSKTIISSNGSVFFSFDVNIEKAVDKSKFNQLIETERNFFTLLDKYKLNYEFYIFTADTNPAIMYPESKIRYSQQKLENLSACFQQQLQRKANKIFGNNKVNVIRFSKIMDKYSSAYQTTFDRIYKDLSYNLYTNSWVSENLPFQIIKHLSNHIDIPINQTKELEERTRRYLSSYAAEGMVFNELSKTNQFANLIWVNNEIVGPSTKATELARSKNNISAIPIIYYFYKKIGDKIQIIEEDQSINNYDVKK